MTEFNRLASIFAATLSFVLGGAWYSSAQLGDIWNREAGDPRPALDTAWVPKRWH